VSPSPLQGSAFANASLYVGDLDPSVTKSQLFMIFSQMGTVVSVGYGYVNYQTPQEGGVFKDVEEHAEGDEMTLQSSHKF